MSSIDWLTEETYNLMKEKYNNMPKKKKKAKMWNPDRLFVVTVVIVLLSCLYFLTLIPH
jgi:hypothetical protein